MKKVLSLFLSVALVALMCFVPAFSVSADNEPVIVVSSTDTAAGGDAVITVSVKNSPAVASIKLTVEYDSALILTGISYNTELGGIAQEPETLSNPVTLNWISLEPVSGDFLFATLNFTLDEEATSGEKTVEVTYNPDDVCDIDENNIEFSVQNGAVSPASPYIKGDINDDGDVNNKDLTRLFQYLSEWDVTVNEAALDVNGDEDVNNKDLTRLFQYLSEWDVIIY